MKKLKSYKIIPVFYVLLNLAISSKVSATDICNTNNVDEGILAASGCNSNGTLPELPNVIINILNVVIGAAGIISVIFIVIGGINYMTSSGDAGKVKKAKDTILYACIGLVVCALSFAIVNWVIKAIS